LNLARDLFFFGFLLFQKVNGERTAGIKRGRRICGDNSGRVVARGRMIEKTSNR
jgi:hypothetical protein